MEWEKQKTTIKMASSNPIISIIKFSNNKQERLLNCRQSKTQPMCCLWETHFKERGEKQQMEKDIPRKHKRSGMGISIPDGIDFKRSNITSSIALPKALPSSCQETLYCSYSYSSFQLQVTMLSSRPCRPREGNDSLCTPLNTVLPLNS